MPPTNDTPISLASALDATSLSTHTTTHPSPTSTKPQPPQLPSADQTLDDLSRIPLFMKDLPEPADASSTDPSSSSDPSSASNPGLEALRSLAYEGTRSEVAENFKRQGNDCVKVKRWVDAREFYSKGLGVLRGEVEGVRGEMELGGGDGDGVGEEGGGGVGGSGGKKGTSGDGKVLGDVEEEEEREKKLEETLCLNRALCNLELQNNRQTTTDTARALTLNPTNTKALYRSAFALSRLSSSSASTPDRSQAHLAEALDAIVRAAKFAPGDAAISSLEAEIRRKQEAQQKADAQRREREAKAENERKTLGLALKARGVSIKGRIDALSDMQDADAKVQLEDPGDAGSCMCYPVLLLYPTAGESELLKSVRETETLGRWLGEVLPLPFDGVGEFGGGGSGGKLDGQLGDEGKDKGGKVELYMETKDGGLVKVGKKVLLGEVLGGGKVMVQEGVVRVFVVPKRRVGEWVEEVKRRGGRAAGV